MVKYNAFGDEVTEGVNDDTTMQNQAIAVGSNNATNTTYSNLSGNALNEGTNTNNNDDDDKDSVIGSIKATATNVANKVTEGLEGIIDSVTGKLTDMGTQANTWASTTGITDSTATYDEFGTQLTEETGGLTIGGSSSDLAKMAILSITDPIAAAKKNPYWNDDTQTYDKNRDANNDGFPDYDSNGNSITPDPAFQFSQGKPDLSSGTFKNGHTTYKWNASTKNWDKMKGDGTKDDGGDKVNTSGKTEFEEMIESSEAEVKTAMQLYQEEANKLLTNQNETTKQLLDDPEGFLTGSGLSVTDKVDELAISDEDANDATIDPNDPNYNLEASGGSADVAQVNVDDLTLIDQITGKNADTYDVNTVTDSLTGEQYNVDPITGKVSDESLVDGDSLTIDMEGASTGYNQDGTKNYAGEALNQYETQNITNIIDTSTVAGKLLAQELGEGNYTDSKSTVLGQLEILSAQFVDANGNPKIPTWCQALSRNVARNIAFTGMTGSGAVQAMCTALMESTLPIAEKDAGFFQDLTIQNLTNRQEATINKAKVLSNFEMTNVDAKTKASIQNAEAFLKMDVKNLEIQNEAEVINTQNRVQGLFEDQKAINAQRLFTAEQQNDMDMFYDQLSLQAETFVAEQVNNMKKFNVGEINDNAEFNASLQNNREQFIANMQFNIDTAIAEWKQNIILTEYKTKADAASADVKNLLGVKLEVMNQLWDEADMLLDYVVKIGENDKDRQLALAEIAAGKDANKSSIWSAIFGGASTMITKYALGL